MGRDGLPGPPGPPGISIQGDKVIQVNVISVQFLLKLFLKEIHYLLSVFATKSVNSWKY